MRLRSRPSRERLLLALVGAGLPILGTVSWIVAFGPPSLSNPDAIDYAQMGREIRRGHGFATLQTFPRHIPYLAENGLLDRDRWPNLYRYPITPLLIAGVLLFLEDPARAAIIQSGIWYLLATPFIYLLARRFTSVASGAVCALLYLADPQLRVDSYSGLTESLAIFLTAVFFALGLQRSSASWKWLSVGGVCGLAYLTRTQMIVLLPIGLGYAWASRQGRGRWRTLALVLVGGVAAASPWLVRNTLLTGSPTFSFSTTRNLLRRSTAYTYEVEKDLHVPMRLRDVVDEHGGAVAAKIGGNLTHLVRPAFWQKMFGTWSSAVLGALLLAWLLRTAFGGKNQDNMDIKLFRRGTVALAVATFLVVSIAFHEPDFYHLLRPFILILACVECWRLLCRWKSLTARRAVTNTGLAAAVICSLTACVLTTRSQAKQREAVSSAETLQRKAYAELSTIVPPDAIIVSSASPRVALYADRRSIRLPRDPAQLWEIADKYVEYRYILLTRRRGLSEDVPWPFATGRQYADFIRSERFRARFRLLTRLPNGAVLYERK